MTKPAPATAPLILLTGFLGAGKTTFLQNLVTELLRRDFVPRVVLNDYENADVDAIAVRRLTLNVNAVSGSCVCCDSRDTLLDILEQLPRGGRNVAIVETNGTTDPLPLLEVLACDPRSRTLQVKQLAIVDSQRWGRRWWRNGALEKQQVKTASHLFISYRDLAEPGRFEDTLAAIQRINPRVHLTDPAALVEEIENTLRVSCLPALAKMAGGRAQPKANPLLTGMPPLPVRAFDHGHAHAFASAQLVIPPLVEETALGAWLDSLPPEVLRVKGVTQLASAPGQLCCFQRVESKANWKLLPLPEHFAWQPLAVLIGSWLPQEELQQMTDKQLPLVIRTRDALSAFVS